MGVDAVIQFKTPKPLSLLGIKDIQYNLMNRFGQDSFLDKEKSKDFIELLEGETRDGVVYESNLYSVNTWWRYYGPGYERGPAMEIIETLLFLDSKGYTVYYGGDSDDYLELMNKNSILALMDYYITNGRFSYAEVFDVKDDDFPIPQCDFCLKPMHRSGWGKAYAYFSCLGCGKVLEYKDAAFEAAKK